VGSWLRTVVRALPPPVRVRLKGRGTVSSTELEALGDERTLLSVLSTEREFRSSTTPEWRPPLTQEASLEGVLDWLRDD
jgi:hypothetical protein